jgi:2-methylcitrate dehydratase PrpD
VLLAREGFTGPEEIFDGEQNIFSICGAQTNPEELFDGLGEHFEITHNTLKVFACAGWRNPIVEACMALAAEHKLRPADIKNVKVFAWKGVQHLPNYPEPRSGLEGKFSAEHAAAVALTDQAGGVKQFSDERVTDPVVTEVRRKTTLEFDEGLGAYQIRVVINTTDGRELSHFIPAQKGDHLNPLSWDELVAKFRANALAALPQANVDTLAQMLGDLEAVNDVAELTRLFRPGKPR